MSGDQAFYFIASIFGFLLLLWGKRLFFVFPSFMGAVWFVAIQDQVLGDQEPRFYLITFFIVFCTILVSYFIFKKVLLRVAIFFCGLYLGFVLGALFSINSIIIELVLGVILGIALLFLFIKLFDVALVIVSSAIGSIIIYMVGHELWNISQLVLPCILICGLGFQFYITGERKSGSEAGIEKKKKRDSK